MYNKRRTLIATSKYYNKYTGKKTWRRVSDSYQLILEAKKLDLIRSDGQNTRLPINKYQTMF